MSADLEARDIVIIGGGISLRHRLVPRPPGQGHRVTILERGHPAGGATSRAAALVTQIRDDPVLVGLARETFLCHQALEADGEHLGRHDAGALHVVSHPGPRALLRRAEAAPPSRSAASDRAAPRCRSARRGCDAGLRLRRVLFPTTATSIPYLSPGVPEGRRSWRSPPRCGTRTSVMCCMPTRR